MIHPVFAIYDSKGLFYAALAAAQTADIAKRAFTDAANDPLTQICHHPTDFSLIEIGSFDDETGVISPCDHVNHGLAVQFKNKE